MRNLLLHRISGNRIYATAVALLTSTLCLSAITHPCFGQSTEPLKTIIPVHIDASTGDITIGPKTYTGANPGMHLLAFKRKPDHNSLDSPDLVQDGTFNTADSANQFLTNVLSNTPDAFLIVNAVGSYGLTVDSVAATLQKFGANTDLVKQGTIPLIVIGNGGRKVGQASQRGFHTENVDGYLAQDTNGNYTFIQTDYIHYAIGIDGTIAIGNKIYPVANAQFKKGSCDGNASNSFHVVVVGRTTPGNPIADIAYCTAQTPGALGFMAIDLAGVTSEGSLVFIATNGQPIPAGASYGTNGYGPAYTLGLQAARLGGYFETISYLKQNDTYSLVGAPPPPAGTLGAGKRARESSSVYPDSPTGELYGILARDKRGLWYSPLNADPTGVANLDLYGILAQTPVPFPHPTASSDELTAFKYINQKLCRSATCNVRNQYADTNVSIDDYFSQLENMRTPADQDCDDTNNDNLPFCVVRSQLLDEFQYVSDIRGFRENLRSLWLASGTTSILSMLSSYNDIQATLQAPAAAAAPNVVNPIVGFVLGLASFIPEVGPLFGLADTAFNFATGLTTDTKGDTTISLTSTVGQLQQQAIQQFEGQATTTATQFNFIYQDWGKIEALGTVLAQAQPGDKWYWDDNATGQILQAMAPAISASYYRSLMPAVYAIGTYYPVCNDANYCEHSWGSTPVFEQPVAYTVGTNTNTGCCQPFNIDETGNSRNWYMPYTYPGDPANIYQNPSQHAYTQGHNTIIAADSWLAISLQTTSQWADGNGLYDPPQESIMSNLFTPRSEGGLGVYRPEFFEGWPFPRVQCNQSDITGPNQGCPWNAASPSLEATGPVTSVIIRAGQATRVGSMVNVPLSITNNGNLPTSAMEISTVSLRTLAGSGEATLVDPLAPIKLAGMPVGSSSEVVLQLLIPSEVTKLMITEEGWLQSGNSELSRFSHGQVVFPKKLANAQSSEN